MVTKRHLIIKKRGWGRGARERKERKKKKKNYQMTVPEDNLTQVKMSFCFQQNDTVHTPTQG